MHVALAMLPATVFGQSIPPYVPAGQSLFPEERKHIITNEFTQIVKIYLSNCSIVSFIFLRD